MHGRRRPPATAYSSADLSGLSQVFTGLSWYAGPRLTDRTSRRFIGDDAEPRARLAADAGVRRVHRRTPASTRSARRTSSAATIPAQTKPTPIADVKIALDTLFNNPNVGPFIGKQLIQRLVTSNPSPAYVGRVAAAFDNNGAACAAT